MEQELLIISKEQIGNIIDKLGDFSKIDACIEEIKRMLDIKSALLWRADAGS
ncbi:MAG: hypothetical protein SVM79_03010 [Chloroflexota bacterium]|nr:hypothetical protein [Chloroflexota bacterium]